MDFIREFGSIVLDCNAPTHHKVAEGTLQKFKGGGATREPGCERICVGWASPQLAGRAHRYRRLVA